MALTIAARLGRLASWRRSAPTSGESGCMVWLSELGTPHEPRSRDHDGAASASIVVTRTSIRWSGRQQRPRASAFAPRTEARGAQLAGIRHCLVQWTPRMKADLESCRRTPAALIAEQLRAESPRRRHSPPPGSRSRPRSGLRRSSSPSMTPATVRAPGKTRRIFRRWSAAHRRSAQD